MIKFSIWLAAVLCWMTLAHLPQAEPGSRGADFDIFLRGLKVHRVESDLASVIVLADASSASRESDANSRNGGEKQNYFQDGLKAFEAQLDREAIRLFRKSIENNPDNSRAYYFLGVTYQRTESYKKAAKALREALDLNPDLKDAHLPLGIALYKISQYEKARLEFSKVLQGDPNNTDAQFFLGLIYLSQKKYEFAAAHLEQAARDKSLAPAARFNLGVAYIQLKQPDKAKREFQEVQQLDPEGSYSASAREYQDFIGPKPESKRPWKLEIQSGIEFSDNVTRVERDEVTEIGDAAAIFSLAAQYKLFDKSKLSATAGYDFFQSVYDDVYEQNFQSHTGDISLVKALKGWELGLDYSFNYNFLDKKDFLQIQTISPSISYMPKPSIFSQFTYMLQEKTFFTDTDRDAISNLFGINQFFFFAQNKGYFLFGVQYEIENAKADRFDLQGYTGKASVRIPMDWAISVLNASETIVRLPWEAHFQVGFSYRLRDFTKATPSIGRKRNDKTKTLEISFDTDLFLGLMGSINYRYSRNDSNLDSVRYRENSLSLMLGHKF